MAYLLDPGIFAAVGSDSSVMSGAKLYFYAAGTTTPLDTYTSIDLDPLSKNTNPVVADANGRFPQIWLVDALYKIRLTTALDVVIDTRDNVGASVSLDTIASRIGKVVYVTDADFGATGDGVTDDTDAIQAAIDYADAQGIGTVVAPAGTYLIAGTLNNPGLSIVGDGPATIFQKSGVGSIFTNAYTLPARQSYFLANAPINSTTITLSNVAHAANFAADTYAIIASLAAYDSPALDDQKKGEFVRIKSIAGAVLTLYGPLTDNYLTADTPELIPVTLTDGVAYRDFACEMDRSVAPVGGADADTELRQVITTRFALEPQFHNLRMSDSLGAGIALEGCVGAEIVGHSCRDFGSATNDTNGTATDGFGGYGYGISERGLNIGLRASSLYYERIRHGYTNGASYIFKIGRPVGASVENGTHINAKLSGWDTHQLGFGQRFNNLWAIGAQGVGFTARCNSVVMTACGAINCLGAAVALYKGSTENAEECLIDGFYARGNNWGTDFAGTDWRGQPTFLDQGTANTFQNLRVDSSYGFLYGTTSTTTKPTLRGVRAKGINASAIVTFAIWLRQTGADIISISDIELDVSNGAVVDIIRSEANSVSNVPNVTNVRWVNGTISGVPFNGNGAGTNFYVNWLGAGYRGFRKAITLNGGTAISLSGEAGTRFQVSKTAAETLVTATGRSVEGARIEIISGSSGITVTHSASGANTFFLNGLVDAVMTSNQRIECESQGGVWVEVSRNF